DIGGSGAPAASGGALVTGSITSTSAIAHFTSFSMFTLGDRIGGANPLPVQIVSFTAQPTTSGSVNLNWTAASQVNNRLFTVERSSDGITFDTIADVNGDGTTSQTLSYSTVDENPLSGTSYYRLQQTDFDGHYSFVGVVPVNISAKEGISIFPNPVTSNLILKYNSGVSLPLTVRVIDETGRIVSTNTVDVLKGDNAFMFNVSGLSAGTYFLQTVNGTSSNKFTFIKE
ncbi:MAG TPA: T9SS type A sorting domain-containing protein, partial [Bacteroidia bacterium]|nr:T9SS type A sorting domain-containing protein [Bacteroidia bacterium]